MSFVYLFYNFWDLKNVRKMKKPNDEDISGLLAVVEKSIDSCFERMNQKVYKQLITKKLIKLICTLQS